MLPQRYVRTSPIFACAAALLLAGCAQTIARDPAQIGPPVPAQFVAGSRTSAPLDARWWEALGDPRLDALVLRALEESPTITQAEARLRQARAIARIEGAARLPQVSASARAVEQGADGPASLPTLLDLGVDVSWEADVWGRISSQTAAARADAQASAADLQAIRQLVVAETARTYLAAVEAQAQVDLSTRVLGSYDELLRQLELRVGAGVSPRSQLALTETDRQSARAGLAARREDYLRLVRRLEALVGDYPDGDEVLAAALPVTPSLPATGIPAELLSRRPDMRAARLAIEAAGFRADAAQASFLPALTLTGSAGTSASRFADLFDPAFGIWSIAGRLLQPVFQGGRLTATLDLREGELDEAIAAYGEAALQALFEVETALAVDTSLAAREAAFLASAVAAEEATRISNLRYGAGIESFFNVLESQQRALFARSAYLSAQRARLANRIDLHLALGGGLESALDGPEN